MIVIGKHGERNVGLDLDILLRTRLLVQANSGGGKSFLLRRLAEQLFGKIPVIIIDPEGEFATLREKFGFVLVGKGGETPADSRSAALVAQKLLELRASAVCDLYEMKPAERHHWTKLFLDGMTNAPKHLWRPTVVIVDEAHTFCPEKGSGESEASDAMVDSATRWRKRRFCAVWATQRLGKLRKDASAELLNRLVGATFEDVDLKRAAELLSIRSEDRRAFDEQMRLLEPGNFFALGRAIAKERILIKVGPVSTSHEIENAKHGTEPPPAPDKVKALLPKLADLPKEAEEKARTEAELRIEIRSLKAQLKAQPIMEKPVVDTTSLRTLESKLKEAQRLLKERDALLHRFQKQAAELAGRAATLAGQEVPSLPKTEELPLLEGAPQNTVQGWLKKQRPPRPGIVRAQNERVDFKVMPPQPELAESNGDLTGPEQRILDAIAWLEGLGIETPDQVAVAFLAGYKYGCGGFNNPRGALRRKALVEYVGDCIRLTESGHAAANRPSIPLTTEELQAAVLARLPGPERTILKVLLEVHPEAITKEDCARRSNYAPGTGGYNNPQGRLRSLGLAEYPSPGMVRARDLLFLE